MFAREVAGEKASALGRAGRALEAAVDAYETARPEERRERLAAVARAFWMLSVQRDAIGLRDTRELMATYRVPREALALAGVVVPTKPG